MKRLLLATLALTLPLAAQAAPLAPKQADAICRDKAVRTVRFVWATAVPCAWR